MSGHGWSSLTPAGVGARDVAFCFIVVEYRLSDGDLARIRFAISPLTELVLSLRAWRDPGRFPEHLPWLREVSAVRHRLDGPLLLALTSVPSRTPDFLNPRPTSPLTRIGDELETLATTDPSVVARDVAALRDVTPHDVLADSAERIRERIVDALAQYWEVCFAQHWPRMSALLDADVSHRAQHMAQWGVGRMVADLEPNITVRNEVVTVRLTYSTLDFRRDTGGEGLTLVPTLFTRRASVPSSPDEPPAILYAARGLANLWAPERQVTPAALVALLGRPRSELLTMLRDPATSTGLAVRLGVSVSAVNQHLRALRAAGLLTSARTGRSVLYWRSDLGDALVDQHPRT